MNIFDTIVKSKSEGKKLFAVLVDPDKSDSKYCKAIAMAGKKASVDFFFVGGSLLTDDNLNTVIGILKETQIPIVLFPGSNFQINNKADGILLLSLISGRNPEFLIGQHVTAAPILKKSTLEILPTGYMLVDCGRPTTVSYISNTTPIPYDKPSIAACTAIAGEMLGLKIIYLDGGSGAMKPISEAMIKEVSAAVDTPIIVGGGIDTPEKACSILNAGADLIVVGNAIEKNPDFIFQIAEMMKKQKTF
jgi:phosphoglycerol geranylgeranyltransferase